MSWILEPPLELPSFYMTPSHRQVVFEGDSLPFQCMASYIDQDMQVLWYQDGKIVETDESQGIFVEKNMIHNCSLIARWIRSEKMYFLLLTFCSGLVTISITSKALMSSLNEHVHRNIPSREVVLTHLLLMMKFEEGGLEIWLVKAICLK